MRGGPYKHDIMDTPSGLASIISNLINKHNDGGISELTTLNWRHYECCKLELQRFGEPRAVRALGDVVKSHKPDTLFFNVNVVQ